MQSRSSASTLFSIRELRMLQRLYRSRELTQQRSALCSAPHAFHQSNSQSDYNYLVYGGRGMLSPTQRALLRRHLSQFNAFKDVVVKLSLFPTTVSQGFRAFSHLREARSLLKGSSYQMGIQVKTKTSVDLNTERLLYDQVHQIQSKFQAFFEYLQTTRFSEESTREFSPSLIIAEHF